jgi:predicted nucleic acid-binding protein
MIYLDASFVCSLHMRDIHTPEARQLIASAPERIAISAFGEVETINAFSLRLFRKEWTRFNMVNALHDLAEDIQSGLLSLMPLPDAAFIRAKVLAGTLTPSFGVRTGDLLHVAAAIELGASALYTFDRRQHLTASAAGLKVNPLA